MNELVFLENNTAVTTSLKVAEYFEKRHDNVIQAVERCKNDLLNFKDVEKAFAKATYTDTKGEKRPMYLLNRDGFMFVVMGFTGEKAAQLKWNYIQAFNQMEQLLQNQRQEIHRAPTPVADMVNDVGATANSIQAMFAGVKRGIALSQAIDIVGSFKNFSLESLKQLIPPAEHDTGYLNATQVGEKLGLGKGKTAARKANALLAAKAWQFKEGRDWRLTDSGAQYGEEMPYTRNGHSGYQIRWNVSVLDELSDSEEWLE